MHDLTIVPAYKSADAAPLKTRLDSFALYFSATASPPLSSCSFLFFFFLLLSAVSLSLSLAATIISLLLVDLTLRGVSFSHRDETSLMQLARLDAKSAL